MKALIFNSGLGNRMGDFTKTRHKSMARLSNGETIIARQLRMLAEHGITEVVLTTGPFADQLIEQTKAARFAALEVTLVPNDIHDRTNYIYSLYLAREHLNDDLLMLHGDLVFNSGVLGRLLADPRPDLGLVNAALPQPEKDFKARVIDGVIREVSVEIADPDCHAFQPLYKLSRRAVGVWLDRVVRFVEQGDTGVYAENALNEVTRDAAIGVFSYEGESVNEVDTLADLAAVSSEIRLFDFTEQPILAQPDDYRRIPQLLRSVGAARPLVVGGGTYETSFIRTFLVEQGVDVVRFSGYSSNPKLDEVRAGLQVFRGGGCDSIISLGGGSTIDVAKCIKVLAATGSQELPSGVAPLTSSVPHLAIPTTAGTGSESTHFAVVYIDGEKHSVAHDAMLPDWVLLEPRLLQSLPEYHKKATLLDALCQCVESSWATGATPQSLDHAVSGIEIILDKLFGYFRKGPFDLEVTRAMLAASNLGGKAINLTKTTAPHAMSYQLTSLYGIAHGHAVALCLVGVWRHYVKQAQLETPDGLRLAPALDRLTAAFGCDTRLAAVEKLQVVLEFLQLAAPSLRDPSELDDLVAGVNQERLGNSPAPLSAQQLRHIYEFVFELRPEPYVDAELEARAATGKRRARAEQRYSDLRRLHGYELQILDAFDTFCTDQQLRYYLSEGSMLGAVRHGGLIPWDDDVDVMMPRADYRRFVELARSQRLPKDCSLDCFETNPRHWVFGAKLQLTSPTEFRLPQVAHVSSFNGPYIDIFPVDPVDRISGPTFRLQAFLLRLLRRTLFMSSGRSRGLRRNPLVRIPLYLLTRVVPTRVIHRLVVWVQSEFNSRPDAGHWANLCTYYPIDREVFPREWFGEGQRVGFEQLRIPVPAAAEQMLEQIYGTDYRGIPSIAVKRTRSHAFTVVEPTP